MIGPERNCADRSVVTAEQAETRNSTGQPAQPRHGTAERERVGRVSEHERDRAFGRPQHFSQSLDALREPPSIKRQQHRCVEVHGDSCLLLCGFDETGMVVVVPRHEDAGQEHAISTSCLLLEDPCGGRRQIRALVARPSNRTGLLNPDWRSFRTSVGPFGPAMVTASARSAPWTRSLCVGGTYQENEVADVAGRRMAVEMAVTT